MNEGIEKIIYDLERCCGMFDYMLTPIENNLLVSYIKQLQQENKHLQDLQKNMDKQYAKLESNWNELKEHLKKQTIDLEMKREDISADTYIDRKMFLKEVLFKMQEIESGKNE